MSGAERAVFTAEEAARYIGMSTSWLWHSDVPRVRLGRAVRFRRVDLDAYVAARVSHGTAAA
jgi:predicted DNA-binding transcriptional regulator AlpA